MREPTPIWRPSAKRVATAQLTRFISWLESTKKLALPDYEALWQWSVSAQEQFWASVWEYFGVVAHRQFSSVKSDDEMPYVRWFEGSELNYVDQVFRHRDLPGAAIIFDSEIAGRGEISWAELERQVAAFAATLRRLGVAPGDRVVAYLPNIPQAVVAFLATASVGAIWSVAAADMGPISVLDRFQQIQPKILIAVDGYRFGAKNHDRREVVQGILSQLPSVEHVVWIDHLYPGESPAQYLADRGFTNWRVAASSVAALDVEAVAGGHPLWILYSSGTTGLPKAIVHSHAGMIVQALLYLHIHCDLMPGDRILWLSSTSWMVWNLHISSLLVGATVVLHDGSPTGDGQRSDWTHLWRLIDREGVAFFGAGAAFYHGCMKAGIVPREILSLDKLVSLSSTGSPLSIEGYRWLIDGVKNDMWISSPSGGTDICGGFLGGVPTLPVYAGEMQCRILGAAVESFNEAGDSLLEEVGELVCTRPLPSMPLFFWGDEGHKRYLDSYFDMYQVAGRRVWRHGDWLKLIRRPDAVGAVIFGRSDATINRQGIRMGTAELYRAVEYFEEITDSMAVDLEYLGREPYMALFIVLKPGTQLTQDLDSRLRHAIRTALSPRHVPNDIIVVPEVPKTLTGKKLELPIKKLLLGQPLEKVVSRDALFNPDSLNWFIDFARERGRDHG